MLGLLFKMLKLFSSSSQSNGGTVEILPATIDDISVFVIPILSYKEEYAAWKAEKLAKSQQSSTNSTSQQVRSLMHVKNTPYFASRTAESKDTVT